MNQQLVKLGKVAITVDKNYWAITKDYDRLVMVKRQSTGVVYISRKPVPAGIEITNRDYWLSFNIGGPDSTTVLNLVQEFGGDPEVAISQKVITEKIEEIEAAIASIDSNSGGHNILPFDGFLTVPVSNVSSEKYTYHRTISSGQIIISPLRYTIVANRALNAPDKFYLKVEGTNGEEDTYYSKWEITTDLYGNPSPGDPFTTLESGVVSKSEWYYREYRINKLFYNRSNKVIYAYEYSTTSLTPITNIQVIEDNAPEPESTSNPDNVTKGSMIVDLENDKLLTWDGNKWKELGGGGNPSTPVEIPDVPNNLAIRNGKLYLEVVSTGQEPVVLSEVNLPAGEGQTVVVQSNEDSPSIVRLDANTSKLGKKVIPLGTSAANLFKNGIRQNDSDVYDQTTYSSDDGVYTVYHIKYEFDLGGAIVNIPENSILKFEGGCIKNGTLIGNNTKVEVDGTYTIFDGVSFWYNNGNDVYGTWRDSELYATNFGAKPDMTSETYEHFHGENNHYSYKGITIPGIKVRTGTDNTNSFKSIRQFLCESNNITINFNGDFYLGPTDGTIPANKYFNQLKVYYANNLTFKGGTSIAGWYFTGCNNVTIDGCSFVGFHEKHNFPYMLPSFVVSHTWQKKELVDGNIVTTNGTDPSDTYGNNVGEIFDNALIMYQAHDDNDTQYLGCSLGIYFNSSASYNPKIGDARTDNPKRDEITITEEEFSRGLIVRNCTFEMLNVGVYLGTTGKSKWDSNVVNDCVVENCTFDHIATQPLSLHARHSVFRDVNINYAWMPFDLSTSSAYCVFENIRITACGIGFKQEQSNGMEELEYVDFPCGHHTFKNLSIHIDDTFPAIYPKEQVHSIVRSGDSNNITAGNPYIVDTYKYSEFTDHYCIKINQGSLGNKFRARIVVPEPENSKTYTITLSREGVSETWTIPSLTTGTNNLKTAIEEADNIAKYINNNKGQFDVYATHYSGEDEVIVRADDYSDYTITTNIVNSLSSENIKRTPYAIKDVARFENCTFKWTRSESEVTLRKNNKDWNYTDNVNEDPFKSGRESVYTFIQCAGAADFKDCKFEVKKARLLLRDGEANTSWTRPYNFDNCELTVLERVTNSIFYQSNVTFAKCKIKYAGIFEEGATMYPTGIDSGINFHSGAYRINITDSDIQIDYGTVINLPANSEFINNRLLYKNPESCIRLNKNAKINNNAIICTLDGLSDSQILSSNISVFYIQTYDTNDEINNNIISTRSPLLYVNSANVPNLSIKNNSVNIINSQSTNKAVFNENADGTLLAPNKDIEICNNIITGTANWRILPDIIRYVNGSHINNENSVIFKGNTIGHTFKDNINVYYVNKSSLDIDTIDSISSNSVGKLDTTGTALSDADKGISVITTDGISYIWTGTDWKTEEQLNTVLGATYFDTANSIMKVYNGSQWVSSEQRVVSDSTGAIDSTLPKGYIINNTGTSTVQIKLTSPPGNAWVNIPLTNGCLVVDRFGPYDSFDKSDHTQANLIYYATDKGKYYLWYNGVAPDYPNSNLHEITVSHIALSSGTLNNAPDINEVVLGYTYYDTVRQKILTATSEGWTDNEGNVITIATKGTTTQRPAVTDITEGFKYYNTETHKLQIYNGTTWIDIEDAASTGIRIDSLVPDVVTGSALSTTIAADINKYYRYDSPVDTLAVTLPELVSSTKVQNVVVYLTAGTNADNSTITFAAATPTEGTAAPVYYQKSYDIEAGKTYEINALYNGAAWIVAAVEIVTAAQQSSNASNNSLLMGGFTPLDNSSGNAETPDVEPDNTETV